MQLIKYNDHYHFMYGDNAECIFCKKENSMDTVRYCPPTRFDTAPYGTIVKVITERDGNQLWIQTAHGEPTWLRMGDVLEHGFENFFVEPTFVDMCLRLNDQAKG